MKTEFSRLRVQGFRHLHDIDITLGPLNVLIGANGIGKTSVLEVLSLLAASANGRLQETLTSSGGLQGVLTLGRSDPMRLQLDMPVANEMPIEYGLSLRPVGLSYSVSEERLSQRHEGETTPFKFINSEGGDIRYYEGTAWKNGVRFILLARNWTRPHFSLTRLGKLRRSTLQ